MRRQAHQQTGWLRALVIVIGTVALSTTVTTAASAQSGPGPQGPPKTPKEAAPIDLTGYWVSIVSEDWRFRMVVPPKGDYPDFNLTPEGKRLADAWDAARDEAERDHCKAYGAPNIMRIPGRFHITWADDYTLKIETDAGTQTRLLRFASPGGGQVRRVATPTAGSPSRQGTSIAQWERNSLRVDTSNLLPGYLQYNGVPFSGNLKMLEYFDIIHEPGGEVWLIDDSVLTDPVYLARSHKRSTHLRKQPDASGWDPQACVVR